MSSTAEQIQTAAVAKATDAASTAAVAAATAANEADSAETIDSRTKWYIIGVTITLLILFILTTIGLYLLGGDDQSPLERLRDIAVIYIVFISLLTTIVLVALTAAMAYLILQIKDQVIPMLVNLGDTVTRVKGTTEFMTEQAVTPIIKGAGRVAQAKAVFTAVTGFGARRK